MYLSRRHCSNHGISPLGTPLTSKRNITHIENIIRSFSYYYLGSVECPAMKIRHGLISRAIVVLPVSIDKILTVSQTSLNSSKPLPRAPKGN